MVSIEWKISRDFIYFIITFHGALINLVHGNNIYPLLIILTVVGNLELLQSKVNLVHIYFFHNSIPIKEGHGQYDPS